MKKEYQVAVIYTVKADTYESALSIVEQATLTNDNMIEVGIIQASVVYDTETDNEGQRVVYLPAIDDAVAVSDEDK